MRPLDPAALSELIRANLPLAPAPGLPHIRLHTAGPGSGVGRLAALLGDGAGAPYWAYPWAGGLALAHHLAAYPEIVAGKAVLDVGAGGGAVAVAAALAGAAAVTAVDVDPMAAAALALNAEANGVSVHVVQADPTAAAPPSEGVVLAGDVFYERALAERMLAFLGRCRDAGAEVLIGDPRRAFLPTGRLQLVAEYAVADFGDSSHAGATLGAVFRLRS